MSCSIYAGRWGRWSVTRSTTVFFNIIGADHPEPNRSNINQSDPKTQVWWCFIRIICVMAYIDGYDHDAPWWWCSKNLENLSHKRFGLEKLWGPGSWKCPWEWCMATRTAPVPVNRVMGNLRYKCTSFFGKNQVTRHRERPQSITPNVQSFSHVCQIWSLGSRQQRC